MGLEFLKRKEEAAKEIYSEFSKGMLSNVYNSETLKQEITTSQEQIITVKQSDENLEKELKDVSDRLSRGQEYKDGLLNAKFSDIDQELLSLNPLSLKSEISNVEGECEKIEQQIKLVVVKEPTQYYHEDKHDVVRREISDVNIQIAQIEIQIEGLEKLKSEVSGGIKCEHCGIELMNAAITQAKIAELDGFIVQKDEKLKLMQDLTVKEQGFTQLKKEFDEYEKNKLIREKYEVSLEATKLKLERVKDKLRRYEESQEKIKKNQELEAQILKAQLRIDELINQKRGFERQQVQNANQIQNFEDKISKNTDLITKIGQEFEREKVYKLYLELYGKNGISKIIMKTMMPVINQELQRLLQDSCYFNLEIRINDKNEVEFIMIDNSTGVEKLMASGSGYERTIASMALRSVLSKICSLPKPNVIVWDEVFGKISNENLELVGEFFSKIKDYFEKIFVITHNPLVSNWADNIVKIKKDDNVSNVIQ
jgi:DNA repair exonuclease SbcCD ATPase subunit